jgi:hypothetical protein
MAAGDTPAVPVGYKPAVHVPPELEALAFAHYSMHGNGLVHNLIAAVLPAHEAMVREQVIKEIEAAHGPLDVNDFEDGEFDEGVQAAIATVRTGLAATDVVTTTKES